MSWFFRDYKNDGIAIAHRFSVFLASCVGGFHCHGAIPLYRWLMTGDLQDLNPLVMTNSSPWFFDGPNRNRWFTVRYKMGGPFHGYVTVYQRVYIHIYPIFKPDSDD